MTGLALALVTVVLFWPALEHDFIDFDDGPYVYQNEVIKRGLTGEGLRWAFLRLHTDHTYWHPLTWISHMLDVEWFGLNPMGHHLMNVLWHAVNVVLLFGLILRLRQPWWAAVLVAGMFGWHPLQVDSVAWVAERKSMLGMFFWLLATWAYVRYTEKPGMGRLAVSVGWCALGLLCKPILVTLPCALLLLDVWPLRRMPIAGLVADGRGNGPGWGRIIGEKIPFFALAAVSSWITVLGHSRMGSLEGLGTSSLGHRVAMAVISYGSYVRKFVWPSDLAVYYPYRYSFGAGELAWSLLLVGGMTAVAVAQLFRRPMLAMGWFWFLGVLFPTIGIVQAGPQQMGDRFVYIPCVGLFAVLAAGVGTWVARRPGMIRGAQVVGGILLVTCVVVSRRQLAYWQDTVTLFSHAAKVTPANPLTLTILASGYLRAGDEAGALPYVEQSLRMNPRLETANETMGNILMKLGRFVEAEKHYRVAVEVGGGKARSRANLGTALARLKQYEEALAELNRAVELGGESAAARHNLGLVLEGLGRSNEAVKSYARAVELDPGLVESRLRLGALHLERREPAVAARWLQEGLAVLPESVELLEALAGILATHPDGAVRNGALALALATEAVRLSEGKSARSLSVLAAAQAEAGRFAEAAATQGRALALVPETNGVARAEMSGRMKVYEAGQPLRLPLKEGAASPVRGDEGKLR